MDLASLEPAHRDSAATPTVVSFATSANTFSRPRTHERLTALQAQTGLGFVFTFRLGLAAKMFPGHASSYKIDPERRLNPMMAPKPRHAVCAEIL